MPRFCRVLVTCSAAFIFFGCATPQQKIEDPYSRSVLNRPAPKEDSSRMQECTWLRNEIIRQQGLAQYAMSMQKHESAPTYLFEAQQRIASLESRAHQLSCPGPASPPIIIPQTK